MAGSEWMAMAAVLFGAVAILPGTLGILMLTHKLAADAAGAKFIYSQSKWLLAASVILLSAALYPAVTGGPVSMLTMAAVVFYGGILVFGFFMHTTLMFRPVRKPVFISLDEAINRFGPEEEVIGVIDRAGKPYAFVARLARRPHVVYQTEGEAPFIMTHCILAHSSMSYALEGDFSNPEISISAVIANNMVFYDKSRGCSVIQIQNKARDEGLVLQTVSTVAVQLASWQQLYPQSGVWVRASEWRDFFYLKLLARADVIDPASPVKVYALQNPPDERLPMKSLVLGLRCGEDTRTYPVSLFTQMPLINDRLGDRNILLTAAFDNDYIQVFEREIESGITLSFTPSSSPGQFIDQQTGSEWSPQGHCIAGQYTGRQLQPFAHYNKIFWYVWADFFPGTEIYSLAPASDESQQACTSPKPVAGE